MDGLVTAALPCRWAPHRGARHCLLVGETAVFRALARSQVLASDIVLELGCSYGDTTVELAARAKEVFALDNSPECVARAASRCADDSGSVHVEQRDALGNTLQMVELGRGCSVIFVDLGGVRAASAPFLELLMLLQERVCPMLMVVKCRALHAAALVAIGDDSGGVVPDGAKFWADTLSAAKAEEATASASPPAVMPVDAGAVASAPADEQSCAETRLCFDFLNKGKCRRTTCTFRHARPDDPEAVADARKRSELDWQPARVRGRG